SRTSSWSLAAPHSTQARREGSRRAAPGGAGRSAQALARGTPGGGTRACRCANLLLLDLSRPGDRTDRARALAAGKPAHRGLAAHRCPACGLVVFGLARSANAPDLD